MADRLSETIARFATEADIPAAARDRARIVLADTLIAILSGRVLPAGDAANAFADDAPAGAGAREFARLGHAAPSDAAFVNGVLAHADETDDSHESARMHPACSIVPAAMASAEAAGADVTGLLDSIAVGYDVGVALNLGTWPDPRVLRASRVSTHHIGGMFGSLGAALRNGAVEADTGATAFSYAIQHAGGATTWLRDTEHVEKAVVFGGLPARSALGSLHLAKLGFSGVEDPFAGPESYFDAFGRDSDPSITRARLQEPGTAVQETCIKRYPIGMPIQAAAQAVEHLVGYGATAFPDRVFVELPAEKVHVVDDRGMDNISLQYTLALLLVTGEISFGVLHELADAPADVARLKERVELVGVTELDADNNGHDTTRIARVTMDLDGTTRTETVAWPTGTPRNPMGWTELERKATEVLPHAGWSDETASQLIALIRDADGARSATELLDDVARLVPQVAHA